MVFEVIIFIFDSEKNYKNGNNFSVKLGAYPRVGLCLFFRSASLHMYGPDGRPRPQPMSSTARAVAATFARVSHSHTQPRRGRSHTRAGAYPTCLRLGEIGKLFPYRSKKPLSKLQTVSHPICQSNPIYAQTCSNFF